MQGKVIEPTIKAGKKKYKKDDLATMRIIVDSIKGHFIPYISKIDTSKKICDALNKLYIVNNIGHVMSLINELHDIRMKKNNAMASYFV